MERRQTPEFTVEIFADPSHVKDVTKAILHTIFFHRIFTSVRPVTRDILNLTLSAIDDIDLETQIDARATALQRQLDAAQSSPASNGGRGQLAVYFNEKKRKKTYSFFGKGGDEDVCWETWVVDVTLARPRNESDADKVRNAMEKSLQKAALKIMNAAQENKDHIPPITTTDANPFPYEIVVNPGRAAGSGGRAQGFFQ